MGTTTHTTYDFDRGLAAVEQLELLATSPLLQALRPHLPPQPQLGRPPRAESAALLVVGAATVVYGSDRAAEPELRAHWDRLSAAMRAAGLHVPEDPLSVNNFLYWRDKKLDGGLPATTKAAARHLFARRAAEMGVLAGDGASSVITVTSPGTQGITSCLVTASRPGTTRRQRTRVVLDVAVADDEATAVVPAVLGLRRRAGVTFDRHYHHGGTAGRPQPALRDAGVATSAVPTGFRQVDQRDNLRGAALAPDAKVVPYTTECGCEHLANVAGGTAWEVAADQGRLVRRRELPLSAPRSTAGDGGTHRWTCTTETTCRHGRHTVQFDPCATVAATTAADVLSRRPGPPACRTHVDLADELWAPGADDAAFAALTGLRNEALNIERHLAAMHARAAFIHHGNNAARHETDLWLHALLVNSQAWAEHLQDQGAAL